MDGLSFCLNFSRNISSSTDTSFIDVTQYLKNIVKQQIVKAVIISTFSLDLVYAQSAFPELLGYDSKIPTLIVHGDKRCSLKRRINPINNTVDVYKRTAVIDHSNYDTDDEENILTAGNVEKFEFHLTIPMRTVAIQQVHPQWNMNTDIDGIIDASLKYQKTTLGVHHPKYILVFTDLGLDVLISTSNLTKPTSQEISWRQFFPNIQSRSLLSRNFPSTVEYPDNDFGYKLQEFVMEQSNQIVKKSDEGDAEDVTPLLWMETFAGVTCLTDSFDFSSAKVDLVSVIPCRDPIQLSEEERIRIYTESSATNDGVTEAIGILCHECIQQKRLLRPKVHLDNFGPSNRAVSGESFGCSRLRSLLLKYQNGLHRLVSK